MAAVAKVCPACGATFTCTHDQFCQCVGITLTPAARAYIAAHYQDCLCASCLREISTFNIQHSTL